MEAEGRVRKPSNKYENEIVSDSNAARAISGFQKGFKKKQKMNREKALLKASEGAASSGPPVKKARGPFGKKTKEPPKPTLSSKDKVIFDAEEQLIGKAADLRSRALVQMRELPDGARDVSDLNAAVRRGVKESCSLLLDWSTDAAKMVGKICKVYWDGEYEWFYARILNYDSTRKRHYIFYESDSTAEWISLENEAVLVGDRLVLAKSWPALHYWASAKAKPIAKSFPGHIRDADYCEYYDEGDRREWGFMKAKELHPIQEQYFPKQQNKRYRLCLEKAQREQETIDEIQDTVVRAVREGIYSILSGEQWVGLRVRASTRSLVEADDQSEDSSEAPTSGRGHPKRKAARPPRPSTSSAMCIGTVAAYSGATDQHFIVFDDTDLQPQWVTIKAGVVDVLVGPGEESEARSEAGELALRATKGAHDCAMCGLNVLEEDSGVWSTLKTCDTCSLVCHAYCVPSLTPCSAHLQPSPLMGGVEESWTCWKCQTCFGCGVNGLTSELMLWNNRRTEPELGVDRDLLVCGDCLYRYKHVRDFCSICQRLYITDDSMLPMLPAPIVVVAPPAADGVAAPASGEEPNGITTITGDTTATGSEEEMETEEAGEEKGSAEEEANLDAAPVAVPDALPPAVEEEENMVECNECARWVHAECEGIDQQQYVAMTLGTHPVWGDEYLCPLCRIRLSQEIITALQAEDKLDLFAKPVTTAVAKNYFDVIRHPMDISTMRSKCGKGLYKSLQSLRQDFELMCLNAMVFNQTGDEYWLEARAFHECVQRKFSTIPRKSHSSAYGFELQQLTALYDQSNPPEKQQQQQRGVGSGGKRKSRGGAEQSLASADSSTSLDKRSRVESETATATSTAASEDGENNLERLALLSSSLLPTALVSGVSSSGELMDAIDKENEANKLMASLDVVLPTVCAPCPDPLSFMACAVTLQSAEEAFYSCCQDSCLLCGSAGASAMFLFCVDCGEAVHSFCADAPLATMSDAVRLTWRCMNCKVCETCGSATEAEESSLIYCERCDRAHHIGCLSPSMPAVPQSRWFCHECVDCTTCKTRANASGAMEVESTTSWGFESDKCQFCTNEEERERQRVIDARAAELAAQNAEVMRKHRQAYLNIFLCNICNVDCSASYLLCRNCGQNSHPQCNPSSCEPWVRDRAPADFMCETCLERTKNERSHLGSGDKAAQLLAEVGRIQRTRWQIWNKFVSEKKAETIKPLHEIAFANRHLLLAVLHWAAMRCLCMERDDLSKEVLAGISRTDHQSWLRNRATRFYNLMRRAGSKSKSEWLAHRNNLMRGMDSRGAPLDLAVLSRYAVMASAFLGVIAAERAEAPVDRELHAVASDMISKFTNKTLPIPAAKGDLVDQFNIVMNYVYETARGPDGTVRTLSPAEQTEERVRDVVKVVKNTKLMLLCGPIGLSGATPENLLASTPLNLMRVNLEEEEGEAEEVEVAEASEAGVVPGLELYRSKKPKPFNPALGYPSSFTDTFKLSNSHPGLLMTTNLLFTGSKLSNGLYVGPASQETTFYGKGGAKKVEASSEPSAAAAAAATVGVTSASAQRKAAMVALKKKKADFVVAMSKHLDSVEAVCLHAGDNHFAKRARLHRLTELTAEEEQAALAGAKEALFKLDDLGIHKLAAEAGERAAKAIEDRNAAELAKAQAAAAAKAEENRRRFSRSAAATAAVAGEAASASNTEAAATLVGLDAGLETAADGSAAEGESMEVSESAPTTSPDVPEAAKASDTSTAQPPAVADEPAGESVQGAVTTTSAVSEQEMVVDRAETDMIPAVADKPQLEFDQVSVAAASVMDFRSVKDASVTTMSVTSGDKAGPSSAAASSATTGKRARQANVFYNKRSYVTSASATATEGVAAVEFDTFGGVAVAPSETVYPYCMEVGQVMREDHRGNRCCSTRPLRGWAQSAGGANRQPWRDPRVCLFCKSGEESHFSGRLLAFSDGPAVHANCLRWSSDVSERSGFLVDCDRARDRAALATCHYCKLKGATVSCMNRRKCGRIYHLKCAAIVNCVFLECKGSADVSEQADFDVFTVILCAEHSGMVVESPGRVFRKWLPMDPNRRLLLEDNEDSTIPELADAISAKRGYKAVRSGALTVLSLGEPRIDLSEFHSQQYIYPYRFKSARIFWSAVTPLQRMVYVMEVLSEGDFEGLPDAQVEYIMDQLKETRSEANSTNSPVFRVAALDNPRQPIFSKSLEHAFDLVLQAVLRASDVHRERLGHPAFKRRISRDSYGLSAHQFFGLGQQFVRHAIEIIPESTAAMVALLPHPQYVPSFKLPTEGDARRIHRLQLAAKMMGAMSANGCVRADGYVVGATRPMGVRMTKILTKVADSEEKDAAKAAAGGARAKQTEEDVFAVDEEREENRREIEYNRQRYLEMSALYLRNPNAKLEVLKSRIHGWGLFARINFEKNDIIVEYIGEKVRAVIADRRETMYEDEGVGSCYLFRLDKDEIVDATKTGGMARFMNHCCEPNAYARIVSSADATATTAEDKHIVIIAARDIQEGEEITYDYKFPIEDKKLKCYCGALKCQGSMN